MLGRPLQPNPAGGPPTVPQALNRYAATPLGQPGVAEGALNGGGFNWFAFGVSFGKTVGFEYWAHSLYHVAGERFSGETIIQVEASATVLRKSRSAIENLKGVFLSQESTSRTTKGGAEKAFQRASFLFSIKGTNLEAETESIISSLKAIETLPDSGFWKAGIDSVIVDRIGIEVTIKEGAHIPFFAAIKTGASFGLDAFIGGSFQYLDDLQNPYLNTNKRLVRAGIAGGGGALFALGAAGMFCAATDGVGCLVMASTAGGLLWIPFQEPLFHLIEARTGYSISPERRLKPLLHD